MKNEMLKILNEMLENGYALFNETPEQFVDRMIAYGFKVEFMLNARNKFMKYKKGN